MNIIQKSLLRLIAALLLASQLAACAGQSQLATPTLLTTAPVVTLPVGESPTVLPEKTLAPTLPGSENPNIKAYTNEAWGITLEYPGTWSEQPGGQIKGPDGFVNLEARASDGARPEAVCHFEANRDKPDRYGSYPLITQDKETSGRYACLILPSEDQPESRNAEAAYLVWVSQGKTENIITLRADRAHIEALAAGLRVHSASPALLASNCDYDVSASLPQTRREDGLRIDEFPVAVSTGCLPREEPEGFNQVVSQGAAARRAKEVIDWQYSWARINALNQRLAPFNVQVSAAEQHFSLYQDGRLLASKLNWIGPLSIRADGNDFILPVIDSYDGETSLLSVEGLHELESWDLLIYDRVFPVFAGEDRISAVYETERYLRPVGAPTQLYLLKNGERFAAYSVGEFSPAGGPVRGLWTWNDHWVLELEGMIVQDGQILNEQGFSEAFSWRVLKDRPFFFYRQNGLIQAEYNSQTVELNYDEVIYEPLCCMTSLLQMRSFANGLIFYARRGDTWYFVVLEAEGS